MNVVVINGTEIRGCTYEMKKLFLASLGDGHDIIEYYLPKDSPVFCTGCKRCYEKDISICPHSQYTLPIWESILKSDLIIMTSPTYVFHATGQIKALLDHYGTKWMVHSPESQLYSKQAVIITNSIGMGTKNVIKDIQDSLDFWGVAYTYHISQALHDIKWNDIDQRLKQKISAQCNRVAAKIKNTKSVTPRLKIRILFKGARFAQNMIHKQQQKKGKPETKDHAYWSEKGWLSGKKPY